MDDIKPGEWAYKHQHVWLWATIAERPSACAIEHGATPDDWSAEAYVCWRETEDGELVRIDPPDDDDPDVIPHHPSLPAVAALLPESGLAAAVQRLTLHVENELNQWPSPYTTLDEWTADAALLTRLAAALNGGTDGK